ncbi:MAG TPA: sialidase family protein, partial [Pirellulales bacterium]
MLFELIREWRRPKRPKRTRAHGQTRLGRNFQLQIDPLEERRLLTASMTSDIQAATPFIAEAAVVGRSIFYDNSTFDGNNPQANAADDGAIAPDKQALLPGAKASFANYTSYSGGINGIMVDIANLAGPLTAADFEFHVGNTNDPRSWAAAPAPASISVRPGAGADGSARVTITWADDAIANRWLQVTVRATAATGLARPDVFYFGNAIGESGDRTNSAAVDMQDELNARNNPRGWSNPAPIDSAYDYNRDGLVSPADELIARKFWTNIKSSLQLITADATSSVAEVLARQTFYNNSAFDGGSASASSADDGAIATDKIALLPGGTANFTNYTSYSRGLNGIMIDVAGLPGTPTLADFTFRVGNSNNPDSWTAAPAPASITVRQGAGVLGSARVTLTWPDGAIQKQWLQISMLPSAGTGLSKCDVFYFGNQIAETGDSPTSTAITVPDLVRIRAAATPGPVGVTSPYDINRDRVIDTSDDALVRANLSGSILNLISLAPAVTQFSSDLIFSDFGSATVAGRYVFYNNSSYDGFTPGAAASDDAAIATDKAALLPGAKATFANYTSYGRGINGIMVDIAGLSGTPTTADFVFRVGNSSNTASWGDAPAPASISVRRGAGVGGSDRVTIVWADNAIQKQWLQVTVRATQNTGLATSDVFYFGNAIGDVGNVASDTRVNVLDALWARSNPTPATTIVDLADFNRDGLVDIADEAIVSRNLSMVTSTLELISAPNVPLVTAPEREPLELFHRGDGGINVFFSPNLVTTNRGTVLAFAEGRSGEDDPTSYAIVMRRSLDGGQTWSPISIAYSIPPYTASFINGPAVVVDSVTGQVFVVFTKDVDTVFTISSSDDGLTWSAPVDITASVKVTEDGNPNPAAFSSDAWGWYAVGPG